MPIEPLKFFHSDIARADSLVKTASAAIPDELPGVRGDILRSAWMFAVGALDSYLCNSYVNLVSSLLRAKGLQDGLPIHAVFHEIDFPLSGIIGYSTATRDYAWFQSSRKLMSRKSILDFDTIKGYFNKFLPDKSKLFRDLLHDWYQRPDAPPGIPGALLADYDKMTSRQKVVENSDAMKRLSDRFAAIFERRHDCIHHCDRPTFADPRTAPSDREVINVLDEIVYLVSRFDEHIEIQFRFFLKEWGCTQATMDAVGYL